MRILTIVLALLIAIAPAVPAMAQSNSSARSSSSASTENATPQTQVPTLTPGSMGGISVPEMAYSDIVRRAVEGKLREVLVRAVPGGFPIIYALGTDGVIWRSTMPTVRLDEAIVRSGVIVRADNGSTVKQGADFAVAILGAVMMAAMIGFILFFLRQQLNGKVQTADTASKVTFDDVAGQDEAKAELREVVAFLRAPKAFSDIGARAPRGVLLEGEPGNGKTLLARAVAGESDVAFFHLDASAVIEMFVGVGPRRIRATFKACRKKAPCILFIDELDSIGKKRGQGATGAQNEYDGVLNQLLTEMDGISGDKGGQVIVIAATNRADMLDPALVRPGRLDRRITVSAPSLADRREIVRVHASSVRIADPEVLEEAARITTGCSGAEVANLINEAAICAVRSGRTEVTTEDVSEARDRRVMGLARRIRLSPEERTACAWHEAGHALVALLVPGLDPIHKATIVPRGPGLGMVVTMPERDVYMMGRDRLMARLTMLLAGRAAESILLGPSAVSGGARDDLFQATQLATEMVGRLGLGSEGRLAFMAERDGTPGLRSANQVALLETEVQGLLTETMRQTEALMDRERHVLRALAEALLDRETLTGAELADVVAKAKAEKPLQISQEIIAN